MTNDKATKPVTTNLSVEVHKKLRIACFEDGVTIAKFTEDAIKSRLEDRDPPSSGTEVVFEELV